MSNLDQTLLDLHLHQSQSGTHCPMLPEEIATHEATGRIVDLDTGEVLPDITPNTRVIPTTQDDIDALIVELRAALDRLERRPADDHAFPRGFKSGAVSAYKDVLRLVGQDVDGEAR